MRKQSERIPTRQDDDMKANATRHVMPKESLDAVNLQPKYRTFVETRDFMIQQARQRAEVFVRDVYTTTKKTVTTPSRVSASTNNSTAMKNTPVPTYVSQMSSNFAKSETEEQESESYQFEQDQDRHGDELFAAKGKGKDGPKGTRPNAECEGTRLTDAGRKERVREEKGTGAKEKEDRKEREDQKENGRIQVTRRTVLGVIPIDTARHWSCG